MTRAKAVIIGVAGLAGAFIYAHCSPPMAFAQTARVGPAEAYPPAGITGATEPGVTQANIRSNVCAGTRTFGKKKNQTYSESVRPPDSFTDKIKVALMKQYSLSGTPAAYELDHLISIEIGGWHAAVAENMATTLLNVWMQPYAGQYGARVKDQVEDELNRQLCSGKMTLTEVQSCISVDWIACGRKLGVIK